MEHERCIRENVCGRFEKVYVEGEMHGKEIMCVESERWLKRMTLCLWGGRYVKQTEKVANTAMRITYKCMYF